MPLRDVFRYGFLLAAFGGPGASLVGAAMVGLGGAAVAIVFAVCIVFWLVVGLFKLLAPAPGLVQKDCSPRHYGEFGHKDPGYRW
jgi:hypothetical protein